MPKIYLVICTLFLFSCQESPQENKYILPAEKEFFNNKFYINLEVNEFWSRVLKIKLLDKQKINFDKSNKKASFVINPTNIQDYIDCGKMNDELYVNYIERIFESSLSIKTTIEVISLNSNSSEIEVISNYQFTSIETGTKWNFATNEPKLILVGTPAYGAEPYRKCLSKNLIESNLINALFLKE
jgi:hypothetical protein